MTGIIGLAAVWLAWTAIWRAINLFEQRAERQSAARRRLIEQARQDEVEDPLADIAAIVVIDAEQYLKAADRRRRRIEDMEGM